MSVPEFIRRVLGKDRNWTAIGFYDEAFEIVAEGEAGCFHERLFLRPVIVERCRPIRLVAGQDSFDFDRMKEGVCNVSVKSPCMDNLNVDSDGNKTNRHGDPILASRQAELRLLVSAGQERLANLVHDFQAYRIYIQGLPEKITQQPARF